MPTVTKIAPEMALAARSKEPSARARTAAQYDALLAPFAVGEWGAVVLDANDDALKERTRLKAAAARRGVALRFARRQGDRLRFEVIAANAVVVVEPAPTRRTELEPAADEQDTASAARPTPPAAPRTEPEPVLVTSEQDAVPAASSAPTPAATPAAPQRRARSQPAPTPGAPEQRGAAQRDAAPAAQPRQAAAADRYRDVLPRWMRDGQVPSRPRVVKRRGR